MDFTLIILLVYLFGIFGIGWHFSRKTSLEEYFINKRDTNLLLMTLSTVATVVGAGATVAIVAEVYNSGISYGLALPISFVAGMIILGLVASRIKEVGDKYGAHTIVDFFAKRFGRKNEILTGIIQLFLLIIWIGVQVIALASLATVLLGFDYYIAVFLTAVITVAYTMIGGLKVDIISDFIQFWVIAIVFVILVVAGVIALPDGVGLFSHLPDGHLNPFAFAGVGWFVGVIVLSGFVYLGNTTHWQRIFSAQTPKIARKAFFLSIPLMVILSLLVLVMGLLSATLLQDVPSETAIFELMKVILPPWLVGIGFAAILAVIMSSIDSLLIGGSAILHKIFIKNTNEANSLKKARYLTLGFGIVGFGIALLIPDIITLSLLVTYLVLIFIPSVFGGLYSQRYSPEASFYSLLIPTFTLLALFPLVGENTFLITTPLSILIFLFFDKIRFPGRK